MRRRRNRLTGVSYRILLACHHPHLREVPQTSSPTSADGSNGGGHSADQVAMRPERRREGRAKGAEAKGALYLKEASQIYSTKELQAGDNKDKPRMRKPATQAASPRQMTSKLEGRKRKQPTALQS